MATWPATIPQAPIHDGYSETQQDGRLTSSMDSGPSKVRRRFTAVPTYIACRFLLSAAEMTTFETFYETTLLGGAETYDWVHPRTGAAIVCRIKSPPTYSSFGLHWRVALEVEVLP